MISLANLSQRMRELGIDDTPDLFATPAELVRRSETYHHRGQYTLSGIVARSALEMHVRSIAVANGIDVSGRRSMTNLLGALKTKQIIDRVVAKQIGRVIINAHRAAHGVPIGRIASFRLIAAVSFFVGMYSPTKTATAA